MNRNLNEMAANNEFVSFNIAESQYEYEAQSNKPSLDFMPTDYHFTDSNTSTSVAQDKKPSTHSFNIIDYGWFSDFDMKNCFIKECSIEI